MRFTTVLTVILVFLSFAVIFGQEDYWPFYGLATNGNGARAAGMGYAFTGIADDASAIAWNPAGLTQLVTMEASAVFRFGFGSISGDYSFADAEFDRSTGFQFNFVSFTVPFNAGDFNLVAGAAYRTLYDFNEDLTITFSAEGESVEFTREIKGGINAISPSVGFALNEVVSFGATVNFLTGDDEPTYKFMDQSESLPKVEFSGTNFELGALFKASPQFSLGGKITFPYSLEVKGEDFKEDVDVPMFYNLGLAFRPSDKVTIAADYHAAPWSKAEDEDGNPFTDENANSFHVGLEYLAGSGSSVLPLRLGFYTVPTAFVDYNDDAVSFSAVTAGVGIIMDKFILDGSFEYLFGSFAGDNENEWGFPDKQVDYTLSDFRISLGAVIHLGGN